MRKEKYAFNYLFGAHESLSGSLNGNCGDGIVDLVSGITVGWRGTDYCQRNDYRCPSRRRTGNRDSSLRELHGHWKQAFQIAILNTLGGVLGALILIHSTNSGFKKLVPVFIMFAGILILTPKRHGKSAFDSRIITVVSWVSTFLVGIYTGYFGAASGLLMIAVLSKIVHENYAIYNSMRNFASFMNNIVAATMFIFTIPIDWAVIIPLLLGLFTGGYIGPIIVRYIPSKVNKTAVGIFAVVLAIILGYQAYL